MTNTMITAGPIHALPDDVLRLIPRCYREWALLSLASKTLADRLGDYHKVRGHAFTMPCLFSANEYTIDYARYMLRILESAPGGRTARGQFSGARESELIASASGALVSRTHYTVISLYDDVGVDPLPCSLAGRPMFITGHDTRGCEQLIRDELPALRFRVLWKLADGVFIELAADVLRRIPRTYREWTLLAMTNKGVAGRLGDYHAHHGYTFSGRFEFDMQPITYKQYIKRIQDRKNASTLVAHDRAGSRVLLCGRFTPNPQRAHAQIYVTSPYIDAEVDLHEVHKRDRTRCRIEGHVYYIADNAVKPCHQLMRDELPALAFRCG